jgi:hypothetical protein
VRSSTAGRPSSIIGVSPFRFMQRAHAGDQRLPMWHDLWTAAYQAIDD